MGKKVEYNMRKEKAVNYFSSGFNCSQSVFATIAEDYGLSKQQALDISAPFGGGMGKLQKTCGAVTGALMSIGLVNKNSSPDQIRGKIYPDVMKFEKLFKEIHETTSCKDLIKVDLLTDEGNKEFKDKNLKKDVCEKCICDSLDILEKHFSI